MDKPINSPDMVAAKRMAAELLRNGLGPAEIVRQVKEKTGIRIYNSWLYPAKKKIAMGEDPLATMKGQDRKQESGQQTISIIKQPTNPRADIDQALSGLVRAMKRHGVEHIAVDSDGNATIRTVVQHKIGS